jgi:H+-transporting ATPase
MSLLSFNVTIKVSLLRKLSVVSRFSVPTNSNRVSRSPSFRSVLPYFYSRSTDNGPRVQFLSFMWNPLSWVMEAAALVAVALSNGEHRPPLWQDFTAITVVLLVHSFITCHEEHGAGKAVKITMDTLPPKAKANRDGSWVEIESAMLVPGDSIAFKRGDIVPADCHLTKAINLSIDQASLTGESPPVSKKENDLCLS